MDMNKIKFQKIDTTLLLIISLLLFLSIKTVLSSYFSVISIILLSFYFFPIKFITNKNIIKSTLNLISDIIVSITLVLLIIAYYTNINNVLSLFAVINFIFLVYYAFKVYKNTEEGYFYNGSLIINHMILIFLLQLLNYS